jgi:hypothetical protein
MRLKVHEFTGRLLDYTRSQKELEMVLNFNPDEGWEQDNKYSLDRLKLALKYKQKNVCRLNMELLFIHMHHNAK